DAVLVVAVGEHGVAHLGRGLAGGDVGDQVRQRVDLDDVDDVQLGVGGVAHDGDDLVDVLGLVLLDVLRAELAVGGQGGAVASGEVVDDDLDQVGALRDRLVEVFFESPAAGRSRVAVA